MKDRRNGIIQLAILVALGAAVLLSLAAPDLEGRDRSREPVEVSVLIRSADRAFGPIPAWGWSRRRAIWGRSCDS